MAQTSEMVVARMFPFAFTGDARHRAIVLSREPEWKIRWILCYGSIWVMGFRVENNKHQISFQHGFTTTITDHHNWLTDELEKNPGSGREITPEFATDHPASHTLTHLTQPT